MVFNKPFPVGLNVDWAKPSELVPTDPYLKNWLLDTGSLTERVQSLCHHFELKLLGQGIRPLHHSESTCLYSNTTIEQEAYQVREVLLCGNGVPWVFARSIIPQGLVDEELSNLGLQPLGKRLFNDHSFTRSAFELCTLSSCELGLPDKQTLWGRRSTFTKDNYNMIVAEVFLPHAPAYETRYEHDN